MKKKYISIFTVIVFLFTTLFSIGRPVMATGADQYTVNVAPGENGIISINNAEASGTLSFTQGTQVQISVRPNAGYEIETVTRGTTTGTTTYSLDGEFNNNRQAEFSLGTFPINEDISVSATFREVQSGGGGDPSITPGAVQYTVNVAPVENGIISINNEEASGTLYFTQGTPVQISVSPNAGYEIDTVTRGTTTYSSDGEFNNNRQAVFSLGTVPINENISVSATFRVAQSGSGGGGGGGIGASGSRYDPSQPSTFRFGEEGCTADPNAYREITSEQIVGSGTGWQVTALPPEVPDPDVSPMLSVTIDYNYQGGPIYIDNWDGFLWVDGDININASDEGYSLEIHNSQIQVWGLPGPNYLDEASVSMAGGILLDNTVFASRLTGDWQIGSEDQKSPKGIEGSNNSFFMIEKDTFTLYTEGNAISGIPQVWARDGSQFLAYADREAIVGVDSLYAMTGSSFEIHYGLDGDAVEPVLDQTVNHMIMYLEPVPDQSDEVFPRPIRYYGDANTNTLLYREEDVGPEPLQDSPPIPESQREYILTDEPEVTGTGSRYYFRSLASSMTRVYADDDGSMVGGTIEILAANGYNDGGYVVEAGSIVRVELLPEAGYQYMSGTLVAESGNPEEPTLIPLTATEDPGVYTFIMPDTSMALNCIFEVTYDQVVTDSEAVISASVTIPDGTIDNGNALFTVEDQEMTDDEITDVIGDVDDFELGAFLDLTLNQMITKDGSTIDPWLTPLTELDSAVTVSLTVDEESQGMTGYRVFRVHEGVTEEIEDVTYLDGVITFETDQFSTYILGWDEVQTQTFTLTYNANGGTGTTPTAATQEAGTTVTVASGSGLSRTGFTFSGWNTQANGSGTQYAVNSNFTFTAGTTLYAQWAINSYTVTFYNWNGEVLSTQIVQYGKDAVLPAVSEREGYRFVGWNMSHLNIQGDTAITALYESVMTRTGELSGNEWKIGLIMIAMGALSYLALLRFSVTQKNRRASK